MSERPIILGGGLAGLSACYHGDGIVYEKADSTGGHARSHNRDGFIFDEGIHVLHTSNKYILSLMEEIGVDFHIKERNAWIVSHGAWTRYPFQANTYGLPIPIVKDCLLGFIENEFVDREKINNYEDWIYFMFGKGIAQHFMIPYTKKFWGVDPKELTTEWVNVRHPRPSLEEVISGAIEDQTKGFGINAIFRYPKEGGFGTIADALEEKCKSRIRYGMEATKIDVKKQQIEFNHEVTLPYEKTISTIPLPALINIIPDAPVEVREAVAKLRTNSLFVVNIGVNRENITDKHWVYFLEKEYSFVRVSFPFNQADSAAPKGMSSIMAEVAYGNDNPLPECRDKIAERVISDLIKAGILLKDDEIVYLDTIDIEQAYVVFDKQRKPAIKTVHDYLKLHNIMPCGRYGMWAYLWSDEAILSGKKAAERLHRSETIDA